MIERHGGAVMLAMAVAAAGGVAAVQQPQRDQVAQPTQATVNVSHLGPQVGERVPDFTLVDQENHRRTLQSLMGPRGLVLLFYRSADWCPYCKTQLVEEQGAYDQVRKNGYGLAALSYDPVPVLAGFSRRRGITFPLLSDTGSLVIKRYGLLNTTIPTTNELFGYPFPGTFVLNREGVVTARFFEDTYQERDTVSSVLVRIGERVDVAGTHVATPELDVTAFSTDAVAAPGTHLSLVLDVTPAARVHVYAPGVSGGYRPIALTVQPQAGLVVRAASFPKPEDYFFEPLNEHVAVYQKPFRIVQDVALDSSREGAAALRDRQGMTIAATLSYQACDDRLCFNPRSVPLSFAIGVKRLDTERAAKPQ